MSKCTTVAECLMADCHDPQEHFCFKHCMEVYAPISEPTATVAVPDRHLNEIWARMLDNFRELGNDEWRGQYAADVRHLFSVITADISDQRCHANSDGDCEWTGCPQDDPDRPSHLQHCPLDTNQKRARSAADISDQAQRLALALFNAGMLESGINQDTELARVAAIIQEAIKGVDGLGVSVSDQAQRAAERIEPSPQLTQRRAEIAWIIQDELKGEDGWQPIESAPKGIKSLLWRQAGGCWVDDWGRYAQHNSPRFTHWQPQPSPPSTTGETKP